MFREIKLNPQKLILNQTFDPLEGSVDKSNDKKEDFHDGTK